jgi:hypothetical protein
LEPSPACEDGAAGADDVAAAGWQAVTPAVMASASIREKNFLTLFMKEILLRFLADGPPNYLYSAWRTRHGLHG